MGGKLRAYDGWLAAILVAALLSIAFWPLAVLLGFHETPANAPADYQSYFQQANWWPYPFFFLGLAPALWLTWQPMLHAWGKLADSGVLLQGPEDGRPDDGAVVELLRAVRRRRKGVVVFSLVLALAVNLADVAANAPVLLGIVGFDRQVDFACNHPAAFVKWIFDVRAGSATPLCPLAAAQDLSAGVAAGAAGIAPPPGQLLFNLVLLLQQIAIVFFSTLAFAQILLHTFLFIVFEHLDVARARGLRLVLNCRSPLNEFGLEHWNYALNNIYWAVSPAMLGVFLSRAATPPENYQPGQVLLGILVPVALIAPMVATIIARQARLPAAWKTLAPDGPVAPEDYRRQQLWPLDRNWSSKLGILLAFALAALSIGFELNQFLRI